LAVPPEPWGGVIVPGLEVEAPGGIVGIMVGVGTGGVAVGPVMVIVEVDVGGVDVGGVIVVCVGSVVLLAGGVLDPVGMPVVELVTATPVLSVSLLSPQLAASTPSVITPSLAVARAPPVKRLGLEDKRERIGRMAVIGIGPRNWVSYRRHECTRPPAFGSPRDA
jgi:hypothetical protein